MSEQTRKAIDKAWYELSKALCVHHLLEPDTDPYNAFRMCDTQESDVKWVYRLYPLKMNTADIIKDEEVA